MTVYLVGAGPGDPDLITVKGARLLERAGVVIYDRLIDLRLLDLVPAGCEKFDVGKVPGQSQSQDEINNLLIESVRQHEVVVRLKGGDPFVFGRGGEEALALQASNIPFEVVPGITSAIAAPAFAGVPVTHRSLATSFTVVTGHRKYGEEELDWTALAKLGGTIVVLMGVTRRAEIAKQLMAAGRSQEEAVVAVRNGSQTGQETVHTTLGKLGDAQIQPPSTIVIGPVAGLGLDWFNP